LLPIFFTTSGLLAIKRFEHRSQTFAQPIPRNHHHHTGLLEASSQFSISHQSRISDFDVHFLCTEEISATHLKCQKAEDEISSPLHPIGYHGENSHPSMRHYRLAQSTFWPLSIESGATQACRR
jgi:hypothetical protein